MKNIQIIKIDEVDNIAKVLQMRKLQLLIDSGVRSAYYTSKARGKIYLSPEVSEKFIGHIKKLGYAI